MCSCSHGLTVLVKIDQVYLIYFFVIFLNFTKGCAMRLILNLLSLHFNLSKNKGNIVMSILQIYSFKCFSSSWIDLFIVLSLDLLLLATSHILFSSFINCWKVLAVKVPFIKCLNAETLYENRSLNIVCVWWIGWLFVLL